MKNQPVILDKAGEAQIRAVMQESSTKSYEIGRSFGFKMGFAVGAIFAAIVISTLFLLARY